MSAGGDQGGGLRKAWILSDLSIADLDALHELASRALERPWTQEQIAAELQRPRGQALGGRSAPGLCLLGYILFWIVADEMEVVDLLVASTCRRQGLGAALLHAAIERAREAGATRVFLEVRAGNTAAQRLYLQAGFVEVGRRAGYYAAEGEDALILQHTC